MAKKLYRSNSDKMLFGVCGGLADYFDIDSTIVRVLYAVITLFTGGFPGIILYILIMEV